LCSKFRDFFIGKITSIKSNIASKLQSIGVVTFNLIGKKIAALHHLTPTSPDEVGRMINSLKCKNSPNDLIPTLVLKRCVGVFAPALSHLANISFSSGRFPSAFRRGHVIPLLKKKDLDKDDPKNYRPITNLVTISKILERLASSRLKPHIHKTGNFSEYQSAYRRGHSTETALLKITDDIHSAMESRSCVVLLALYISAAFDTINHEILLKRLRSDFEIMGVALKWIRSYISDRECYVAVGSHVSNSWNCESGIPQGSVLGPLRGNNRSDFQRMRHQIPPVRGRHTAPHGSEFGRHL